MTHRQYVDYCRDLGLLPEDYEQVQYPHTYLLIWLDCRRQADPVTGRLALYLASSYEMQDAELTLALEVLEEEHERHAQEDTLREEMKAQMRDRLSMQGM